MLLWYLIGRSIVLLQIGGWGSIFIFLGGGERKEGSRVEI